MPQIGEVISINEAAFAEPFAVALHAVEGWLSARQVGPYYWVVAQSVL
jgi:Ni/Fe-hydrogenase subunit HybB-like protein